MKMPWKDKTGLAKAAAILATVLLLATVTCGVNGIIAMGEMSWSHFDGGPLIVTGYIELLVIAGSLIGLFIVLVLWIIARLRRKGRIETDGGE